MKSRRNVCHCCCRVWGKVREETTTPYRGKTGGQEGNYIHWWREVDTGVGRLYTWSLVVNNFITLSFVFIHFNKEKV